MDIWKEKIPPEGTVLERGQNETPQDWFKITIPYGRKYDKTWLLNSIQSHCTVSFTPVDFHYVRMQVKFFVQDASAASALKNVRIYDEENRKINIYVNSSSVPYSVQNKLGPEQVEQLKLTMNKRYNDFQQSLDLQSLRFDPDLVGHDIDMILNRRKCMDYTLNIIKENFPELLSLNLRNNRLYQLDGLSDIVQKAPRLKILNLSNNKLKSVWELEKIKGLKLEELWLQGNALCNNFSMQSNYVSSILQLFPKLLRLDGQELPTLMTSGSEDSKKLPVSKGSFFGSETLKNQVFQFLRQYYWMYDHGDRQGLVCAYHDEACFSMTITFDPEYPAPSSLGKYSRESRNMKKIKDPVQRICLLKHKKHDVVNFLNVLPKTQHDFNSLLVDMYMHTVSTCFLPEAQTEEVGRSLRIMNDQLSVRDASPKEFLSAFSTPVFTPSSTSMSTLSQEQQEMMVGSPTQSGMDLEWFQK
ncbi:nuclear RNA export factor 2-like [Orycteropus afer afer]|uniref:Nuclear RNA export factor 2-like n=1 Tax=Orycteropus afer afer TaxID=1230840 RepID=A0A8B7BDK5_ORYAF|nr:nuclear RNA export factor 2-like [Orycteropus afer afer]